MKKYIITVIAAGLLHSQSLFAGNPDRSGQAAASELLVNPWAATGGMFGMNGASVKGLEAMKLNIAGLANTRGLELGVVHNAYLTNTGVQIVDAGFSASFNERSKIGVNLMSINYGNIPVTTVNTPQGIGTSFRPSFNNISLGYAYNFGKNIDAGLNLTFVNEGVANAKASAVGIDAGIQYTTGFKDELHFGVTLKNVGSNIRFAGDGLSYTSTSIDDDTKFITVNNRSEKFGLPTQLGISTAYDIYLGAKNYDNIDTSVTVGEGGDSSALQALSAKTNTRLTLNGSFISNSFINDNIGVGAEFALREKFFLRAGYRYETGIIDAAKTSTIYSGVAAGAGLNFAFNKESNKKVQIDYAFKPARMGAVHAVSIRLLF